ncbi:hypothetical protein ACHOLT_10485 [Desulfitobacterium sp. Sab5]|uniref:hypothetical protein n=1 Tax=Desulfitobacterium nosdiversum TaxID=3375356 RepID=UPI003CEE45FC
MELDTHTLLAVQISAAVATNALAALRAAVTDAKEFGMSSEEIRQIMKTAQDIQEQPLSHTRHLMDQLLRETKKKTHDHSDHDHVHGPNCGCGHHS